MTDPASVWQDAAACSRETGVGSTDASEYIEWLRRNAPPRSSGKKMTRRQIRHQAKMMAIDKHCAGSLLGFFGWWLLNQAAWALILKVVEWWFGDRDE